MRCREFKERQKEALSSWKASDEQKKEMCRLMKKGTSKKLLCVLYGVTYRQLKMYRDELNNEANTYKS